MRPSWSVVANLFTVYKALDENQEQFYKCALHKAFYPVVEGYALLKCDRDIAAPMTDSKFRNKMG